MATTTRVAAAQDALVDLLRAKITDVQVDFGDPVMFQDEHIFVSGTVTNWTQQVVSTGLSAAGGTREEEFSLFVAFVVASADPFKRKRDRLMEFIEALEGVVQDDATLGGVLRHADIIGGEMDEGERDSQTSKVQSFVVMEVSCTADLVGA